MKKVTTVLGAIIAGVMPTPSDANIESASPGLTGEPEGRVQPSQKMAQVVQDRATTIRQKALNNPDIYQADKWKDAAGPFARDGAFSNFARGNPADVRTNPNPVVNPRVRTQQLQQLQQQKMNELNPLPGSKGSVGPAASAERFDVHAVFDKFKPT